MNTDLSKQYNNIANDFSDKHNDGNKYSNEVFFNILKNKNLENKKILDLACGDGTDMVTYKKKLDAEIYGIDASEELINKAKEKSLQVQLGYFEKIPFSDFEFDAIFSKYAIQTIDEFSKTYPEIARVLKNEGRFIFLAVHPMRQFFENRNSPKDFFQKTTVKSILFGGTVIVEEPTHTMQEYLSPEFFKYFKIDEFVEASDFYSAEKIGDSEYPTYMIISAIKR